MRLKSNQTMATAIEQLVVDPQSHFLEMKSLQPYSTRDEYLYAMKEDLADWLSNMYPDWRPITADSFLECLENGVLLCHHANNVNDAARKYSSTSLLTNCKYRSDARAQTFTARDNVSQFIKWSRRVAGVREVLMFESDDLILRKNEKNFLLCLLEIARFGAKFGVSVPAIIKLEDEIEREIERDKQTEKLSFTELKRLQQEQEAEENQSDLINHEGEDEGDDKQIDTVLLSNSNDANELQQQQQEHIAQVSNNNIKERQSSEESYDNTTSNEGTAEIVTLDEGTAKIVTLDEGTTAIVTSNEEPKLSRTSGERQKPIEPPASSSHLHKTVVQIVNSCSCSQRFPVIRIGEGKYRIGENGTIIFIRILRNHVMVRVGGGWDTLENYLNKHDPCRRSGGHRRSEQHHHHHHSDIPILAMPNTNISASVQKNTPFGKSVTIKTEEFPLTKPSNHDTNLVDAQLVITRGADGRHRIGQITYKSEEDILNQQPGCPHHHHHQHNQSPPTITKLKTVRSTGRSTSSSIFNKQSSPSTDQDYSSLTETTTHSKPSSSSSLDFKEESIEQPMKSLNITSDENRPPVNESQTEPLLQTNDRPVVNKKMITESTQNLKNKKSGIIESIIDTIDGDIHPSSIEVEHDFNLSDIEDVMGITKKQMSDENITNMDNDSLESSEGVLEEKKKPALPPPSSSSSTKKSGGYTSAFYLAQKQKYQQEQAANRKRSINSLNRYSSRSNTVPNVVEAVTKEEQVNKQRPKPMIATQRSRSSELTEKINDISKLDRDSGFDEQDFRRERLLSNGDDNSSVSSMKSARSSTVLSTKYEYRDTKSSELRMKKLEAKRNSNEKDSPLRTRRNINSSSVRRGSEMTLPTSTTNKYRKNSQPIVTLKQQPPPPPQNKTVNP